VSTPAAGSRWEEDRVRDALQFIAEGLTELVGFGVAIINVRRGDDFVAVAVAGVDKAIRIRTGEQESIEDMLGTRWPAADLDGILSQAQDWGRFKFVPHDRVDASAWTWMSSVGDVPDEPDAWHPRDGAVAPIVDARGVVRGVISVDEPRTGRHPDPAQLRLMDKYAEQTARVVLGALEREELAERLALARSTRSVIRAASRHLDVDRVIDEVGESLMTAFAAVGMWTRLSEGSHERIEYRAAQPPVLPSEELIEAVIVEAARQWSTQQVGVVGADGRTLNVEWPPDMVRRAREFMAVNRLGSVMHVPLGAGDHCLGSMLLIRPEGSPWWSADELAAGSQVGADLGRIILNAQTVTRERRRAEELRNLDRYKSRLLATLSHELRNPLTITSSSLELLHDDLVGDAEGRDVIAGMERTTRQMSRLVDSLLLLAKVADPDSPVTQHPVDLRELVRSAEERTGPTAARRGLDLDVEVAAPEAVIRGDGDEVARALDNVIDNALRFTPPGGTVSVCLDARDGSATIEVADTGIGIPRAEQGQLFSGFFRSADPAARERRGSGLGLAIVDRILHRHGGSVTVTSTPGVGSTFRLSLPLAAPDRGQVSG